MKNWEFYEDELKEHSLAFALMNNKVYWCSDITCSECAFSMGSQTCGECGEAKLKWLYQEHKEPIVLTDDEKSLCKLLGRGWIARDMNGDLWWYKVKPEKKGLTIWTLPEVLTNLQIGIAFHQCKFDFIKWEDEEPWEVKVDDQRTLIDVNLEAMKRGKTYDKL